MRPRLLIDISQFAGNPFLTGIQRTLLSLAKYWPREEFEAAIGFSLNDDHRYTVAPLSAFLDATSEILAAKTRGADTGLSASQRFSDYLRQHRTAHLDPHEIPEIFDGYLFPEFTFDERILDNLDYCVSHMGSRCMAISYDVLPQTNPQYFFGPHLGFTDRYFLSISRIESIAFISNQSKRIFENRLRRSPVPNAIVIPLGADALGHEVSGVPPVSNFVVVGTVEPRKRHALVLAAFDRLWREGREYRLRFLGRSGWYPRDTLDTFKRRAQEEVRFDWHKDMDDAQLSEAIRLATGAIFASEIEGYGLPPLEALSLGCPVIVTADMPSLEGLSDEGQKRLTTVTEETIASAVDQIADPAENARLRKEIADLDLRSWQQVVTDFAAWVHNTITESGRRFPQG